jgi:2-polyprenyl-6-methoxyphenol hydroxylase-like FAD-dependent oxidoreductase
VLARLLPKVPGALDVGHPQACEALARTATEAGATVLRGVGDVEVVPGTPPTLRYELDDLVTTVSAGLVVGADGRTSSVRRQLGLALHETAPRSMLGGMLVDGLDGWPADQMALGTEGDVYYLVFPRSHGRARLYLLHDLAQRGRFAGPIREARFLDAFALRCLPDADVFRSARPAGPCAFYPMTDTWTDGPCGAAHGLQRGLPRRPRLGGPRLAPLLGPDNVPAEAFGPENVARILAMG